MARLVSYLAHPFIMPMIGVIFLLQGVNWMGMLPSDVRLYTYLIVAIFTLVIPLIAMQIFKSGKIISDFFMPTAEERKVPFLFISFIFLIAAFILQRIHAPMIIPLFINSLSVVVLFCALISWKWKISFHMAVVAGVIGLVLGVSLKWMMDFRIVLALLILAAGISGWARLKNSSNTPAQVYAGFGLGFTVVFLIVRFI